MPRRFRSSRLLAFLPVLGMVLGITLLVNCGGGGSSGSGAPPSTPTPDFSLGSFSLTLSAKASTSDTSAGTITIPLNRRAGFMDAITLSIGTLPLGVKANFNVTSTTGDSAELTVQAGYPDPSDATFKTQVVPNTGTYPITFKAVSGGNTKTGTLSLKITNPTGNYALALVNNGHLDGTTAFTLHPGSSITRNLAAYVSIGSLPSSPVSLSTEGLPNGISVQFSALSISLNDLSPTVTFTASSSITPGTYGFRIKGMYGSQARYLPVTLVASAAAFWIESPTGPTVAQGQTITFPLALGHNDTFFVDNGGTDPTYIGSTDLSAISVPSGLSVVLGDPSPTAEATVPITISAPTVAPGTYNITLRATRVGGQGESSDVTIPVTVTSSSANAATWIERVEWGQTVMGSTLKLVPGKPALLRLHVLADRPGASLPVITAVVKNGNATVATLPLTPPALTSTPTETSEGYLATTYTATLPSANVFSGMTVVLQSGGVTLKTLTPNVQSTAYAFPLKLVPIVHNSKQPLLPADSDTQALLLAVWPLRAVNITHRAPYTTSTVIPTPTDNATTDHSGDGWSQLLSEITSLRIIDGSSDSYFGMFNLGLPSGYTGKSTVGLHWTGIGAGIGIDAECAKSTFGSATEAIWCMAHELGHGFGLQHSPVGGADSSQLNYPYQGASTGCWGYDPTSGKTYDPRTHDDIMGYGTKATWISDWNYLAAMNFADMQVLGGSPIPLADQITVDQALPESEQVLVSGWQGPDGQIHLSPLIQTTCKAVPAEPGMLELALTSDTGTQQVTFGGTTLPDLPNYRHFSFTIPVGEWKNLEIRSAGKALLRRQATQTRTASAQALVRESASNAATMTEADGILHLRWNAATHPYLTVIHEGVQRTTLALNLEGGSADLPIAELPSDGQFVLHFSDGLNTVRHTLSRTSSSDAGE